MESQCDAKWSVAWEKEERDTSFLEEEGGNLSLQEFEVNETVISFL